MLKVFERFLELLYFCRVHHQKQPHHFIGPHWVQLKPWMDEVERRKKIRNEIRRGRRKDDVRDVDIRPKSRYTVRALREGLALKGVTYHYPDIKEEKKFWKEDPSEKFDCKHSQRFKEERGVDRRKGEFKLKSEVHFVEPKVKNKLAEDSNIKVIDKSIEKNISVFKENLIDDMDEVKTIKEIKIVEDDPPKDNIKVEEKDPTTNDSLSADEDKTIKRYVKTNFDLNMANWFQLKKQIKSIFIHVKNNNLVTGKIV